MIFALRKLGKSFNEIAELLTEWGFPIKKRAAAAKIYNKIDSKKSFISDRKNCGRKEIYEEY